MSAETDEAAIAPQTLRARLRAAYAEHADPSERALLLSWMAFGTTFAGARAVTHALRRRDSSTGGAGGIVIAGRHLHHYNMGILALAGVGGIAVHGSETRRRHPALSITYGTGLALIVDELALLLDLSDVYWANDGRVSVDAAVGTIAVGGAVLAATSFWGAAVKEVARPVTRRGSPGGSG